MNNNKKHNVTELSLLDFVQKLTENFEEATREHISVGFGREHRRTVYPEPLQIINKTLHEYGVKL